MTQTDSSETLYEGRFLRLIDSNGWEYVDRIGTTGVVMIAAVTDSRHLILVEQFRPPIGRRVIEMPAGLAGDLPESADELLTEAARRELLEETGYQAGRLLRLTEGPPSAGLGTEVVTFFLAEDLSRVGPGGGDASEDIVVHEVPLDEVHDWLEAQTRRGAVVDPKTYAGLYFVWRHQGQ